MAKFFIDRPIFAIVVSIFIVLAGLIAGMGLADPVAEGPGLHDPAPHVG